MLSDMKVWQLSRFASFDECLIGWMKVNTSYRVKM
jgi:hypothetical protein